MAVTSDADELISGARAGDRRAIGRLISLVEDDLVASTAVLSRIHENRSTGWVTGITGAPGAGKSTLVDHLVAHWREQDNRVAVLAVDPTSPFTGGALLGDRIRMQHSSGDQGVLVRSMATRGWLGGMARATERVAALCIGIGYHEIVIETVGVGQSEVDVAAAADTTVVVVTPGWGDGVQVAKAGIMEIADVFVVNKADRDGAADAARELTEMLRLTDDPSWRVPVVTTVGTSGDGVDGLLDAISSHRDYLTERGDLDSQRREGALRRAVVERLAESARGVLESPAGREVLAAVVAGDLDPWSGAAHVLEVG
ncbi:MAG: methylmalonyl Co-A mutase-associated GTPase MeaB [Acidimicrobiia bacterium]|nr:methylmalonyl Co-A mutase-associated GTPase MeaB [Acidimicrobiia bacterium]